MTNVQKIRNAYETKAQAEDALAALKELLRRYRKRSDKRGCPLCDTLGPCRLCPWYVLTGDACNVYRAEHFPKSEAMNYTSTGYFDVADHKAYREARMRQLPKWIFSYEQALKDWR